MLPRSIGPGSAREPSIGPRNASSEAATPDPNDPAVLRRAREGDPEAVKAVVDACIDAVYGTCHRMLGPRDAADLAQESIARLLAGLPGFDGRSAITTWAIRVAMNACLGHLRRERYRRHAPLEEPGGAGGGFIGEAGEPGPLEGVQRSEAIASVRRGLDRIDPSARAILVLRDLQGLEYEQIAEVLQVPIGTVKSRLFRARAALREQLERDVGPGGAGDAGGGS